MIFDSVTAYINRFNKIDTTLSQIQAKQAEQDARIQKIEDGIKLILLAVEPQQAAKLVLTLGTPIPQ